MAAEEAGEVVRGVDVALVGEEGDGAVVLCEDVEGAWEDVGGAPGDVGEHLGGEAVWVAADEVVAAVGGWAKDDVRGLEEGEGVVEECGGEVGDVAADEDGGVVAGGECLGDAVVHAGSEVVSGLRPVGVVVSEPGRVVFLGMVWVVAKDCRDGEAVGGGEDVGGEGAIELGCVLWCEGWGQAAFDVSGVWVFEVEEEAGVGWVCYGVISFFSVDWA